MRELVVCFVATLTLVFPLLAGCITPPGDPGVGDEDSRAMQSEIEALTNSLEKSNSSIENLSLEIENLMNSLVQSNASILNLSSELDTRMSLLSSLNDSIIEYEIQTAGLTASLLMSNENVSELQSSLIIRQQELINLSTELYDVRQDLFDSLDSVEEANTKIQNLERLIAGKNETIHRHLERILTLEQQIASESTAFAPLLFESHNPVGVYMNHMNWNGGLWDRVTFNETGIPIVMYSNGPKHVPTTAFHWGLVCISKYIASNNITHFEAALEIAHWAVQNQSNEGGWEWSFSHDFHGGVLGTMDQGWYGAMTQGLGMSFLSRMYEQTGNASYKQAALNAVGLFNVSVEDGGVYREYHGLPWYEEYPTPNAGSFVLNGYIYSLIGLYDAWVTFNSSTHAELYQDGIDTLHAMIGIFDLGCSTSYDLVHHSVPGTPPNIARDGYHRTHISLLSVLNSLENDDFQSIEDRWIGYGRGQCYASPNGANSS